MIASALEAGGVPRADIRSVIMADGGEGTAEALNGAHPGAIEGVYEFDGDKALLLSCEHAGSSAASLAGRPLSRRSSYALGAALRTALESGRYSRLYVGIGGTFTADGGAGFLQALGWSFVGDCGRTLQPGISPADIASSVKAIVPPPRESIDRLRAALCGLADVKASLCSRSTLSALDFLSQKGLADTAEEAMIDSAFHVLLRLLGRDGASGCFDGAGGGLGFALSTVIGAPCISGAGFVLDRAALTPREISLIITGEGCIDSQTLGGKVVDSVNAWGRRQSVPVLSVGGVVRGKPPYPCVISTMSAADAPPASPSEAAERLFRAIVGANINL